MPEQSNRLQPANASRLYFLDWVRIFAFMLLIFYHTGMYYVTWDFHIKSPFASDTIEPLMMLSSPWRLSLLFLISGVASSFMLDKIPVGTFLRMRSRRLLIPLLFGMLVIVPPQSYFEVIEKLNYQGSFIDFMGRYLGAYHGFCKDGHCLTLPTWNHLWFVSYLWAYTVVLGGLVMLLGARMRNWSDALGRTLTGWKIYTLPLIVLAVERIALFSLFPSTHDLVYDWFNHANYFFLFVLGVLLARQSQFWMRLDALRWMSFGIAISCWAFLMTYFALPDTIIPESQLIFWRDLQRIVFALCEWSAILTVCGFAHRHLQFDSSQRRYLTDAVFPVYIVHQTLIITMAHLLKPVGMSALREGMIIVILTFTLSFGIYEIVRRIWLLRPLFGLSNANRPIAKTTAATPVAPPPSGQTAINA
ncbi:MAG: acyltransferase family protein [Burkholderiales bacterium]|nr:acyltransferase family protein [Burkholderiales bacterium]